jgi:hypothetical protein
VNVDRAADYQLRQFIDGNLRHGTLISMNRTVYLSGVFRMLLNS